MKRTILTTLSLLAAAALGLHVAPATAAEKTAVAEKKAEKAEAKEAAGKPFPYTGKVTKVDASAKTFSLNGAKGDRVFLVDDATKITKDGQPATLADLTAGEEVRGSVAKTGTTQTARSLMIGPKPGKETPAAAAGADASAKPSGTPVKGSGAGTAPTGTVTPASGVGAAGSGKGSPKPGDAKKN